MTWPHVSVYIVIHFFNSISSTVPYYFQKIKARLILYIFLIFELVLLNKRQQGSSKAHAPRQAWNAFSVLSAGNILTHITLTCIISMMQGEKLNGRNTNTSVVFQKIIAYRSEAHFAAIWQSWGKKSRRLRGGLQQSWQELTEKLLLISWPTTLPVTSSIS